MRAIALAVVLSGIFGAHSFAQTSESQSSANKTSIPLEAVKQKKFEEDKRITDLETKAQAGSLSRYSLKFTLGYDGPPVSNISDSNRPNPDNRPGDNRTSLSGSAGLRFRASKATAMSVSTGMKYYTPVQVLKGEDVEREPGAKTWDISDPGVGADTTYLLGGVQSRSSVFASYVTNENYKRRGQVASFNFGQSAKWVAFQSRMILGLKFSGNYFAFGREYQRANKAEGIRGDGTVSKYMFTLIPSLEYKILDNLNFNTSVGWGFQNLRSDPSWANWKSPLSGWRVGLGWAITREIYMNPYVNFFAEDPNFDTASLNIDTVFSIF